MNLKKKAEYLYASVFFTFFLMAFTSCSKSDPKSDNSTTTTPVAVDSGKVTLHVHSYLGEEEIDGYNIAYTLDDGRKMSMSMAQFYISDIRLVKEDGSLYEVKGKIILKTLDELSFDLGSIPAGNYTSVKFRVGLDSTENSWPADSNAYLNHSEMWFGSTAQPDGYIFINAQGAVDTAVGSNGATMQPFIYKIGTNAHDVQVSLPVHPTVYSVTKDNRTFIHIICDYATLFGSLSLSGSGNLNISTVGMNALPVTDSVAKNMSNAFRYEE